MLLFIQAWCRLKLVYFLLSDELHKILMRLGKYKLVYFLLSDELHKWRTTQDSHAVG